MTHKVEISIAELVDKIVQSFEHFTEHSSVQSLFQILKEYGTTAKPPKLTDQPPKLTASRVLAKKPKALEELQRLAAQVGKHVNVNTVVDYKFQSFFRFLLLKKNKKMLCFHLTMMCNFIVVNNIPT